MYEFMFFLVIDTRMSSTPKVNPLSCMYNNSDTKQI